MSQAYSYDVAATTNNGKINDDILVQQIVDAGLTAGNPIEDYSVLLATANDMMGLLTGGTFTVTFQTALSAPDKTTLDGLVAAHDGVQFAPDRSQATKASEQTNTATSYVSALTSTLNVSPLAAGRWRISYFCEARLDSVPIDASQRVEIQVLDNTASIVATQGASTDQWTALSGQLEIDYLDNDSVQIDLQFRTTDGGNRAHIRAVEVTFIELTDQDS